MSAYYNEHDPFAAAWLRNLIADGLVADGDVDERSIVDVSPEDLTGYTQCHFFAGIGIWSLSLRLAGFPDDGFIWTGSCPCQPFSAAGSQGGGDDDRHLWPIWFRLISECRPDAIFGEQVEGAVGFGWLDRVFADLEDEELRLRGGGTGRTQRRRAAHPTAIILAGRLPRSRTAEARASNGTD
jgi:DNA (cytosine-5)-methyltransferase 1